MTIGKHPVHVMLIHFPVAFWPAHGVLHVAAGHLPAGVASVAGFWLLAAGCGFGWLAALAGGSDLITLWRDGDRRRLDAGLVHAIVNGCVLSGFTMLAILEMVRYPAIQHGAGFLAAEAALIAALFVGNYLGGRIRWTMGASGSATL